MAPTWAGPGLLTSTVAKHQKIEGPLVKKFFGKSQCRKKTEKGTRSDFLASIVAKHQKIEGDTLGNFLNRKSLTMKGGPFSLTRYCMLRGKLFLFSSLGEMVQFDTIIFRRTFEELFWSVRVD